MSASNVFIRHWKKDKLVQEIETHNVWTYYGRQMLAQIVAELPPTAAPTSERDERIRHFGLGIGGKYRNVLATQSPLVDAYPPGTAEYVTHPDENFVRYTDGSEYDQTAPYDPLIRTLELPVRVSGSEVPYPGQVGDQWLLEPSDLWVTHLTTQELTVHVMVDATAGQYVYGSFSTIPVTEAGLFTNVTSTTGQAYQQLAAYVGFDTLALDSNSKVEFVWRIRFA